MSGSDVHAQPPVKPVTPVTPVAKLVLEVAADHPSSRTIVAAFRKAAQR